MFNGSKSYFAHSGPVFFDRIGPGGKCYTDPDVAGIGVSSKELPFCHVHGLSLNR